MSQNDDHPQIIDMERTGNTENGGRYYAARPAIKTSQIAVDPSGCIAPFVTLTLIFTCLIQFGVLAAIGFFFFYVIGAILGVSHLAKRLANGLPANPWAWRVGNWIISFLLTVWLAGGTNQ